MDKKFERFQCLSYVVNAQKRHINLVSQALTTA